MKHDAIPRRELPRLIRFLQEHGSFAGVRGGRQVRLEIDRAEPLPILYGVKVGAAWIYARALTVYAASDGINHLAKGARA